MNQSIDIPFHDIMPLVDVHESSIYWFGVIIIFVVIIFISGLILFLKWKKNKKIDERRFHYEALQNIDFKNPKQSAYNICKEGHFFAHDTEQMAEVYQNLFNRLEPYKYAPKVPEIDEETLKYYYRYLALIKA